MSQSIPVHVYWQERTVYTREIDQEDSWDQGETYTEVNLLGVYTDKESKYANSWETFEFDGYVPSEVYIVWVRYSTGSTFGHESGRMLVLGAYETEEEAIAEVKLVNSGKHPKHYTWDGYFEKLESVDHYHYNVTQGSPDA